MPLRAIATIFDIGRLSVTQTRSGGDIGSVTQMRLPGVWLGHCAFESPCVTSGELLVDFLLFCLPLESDGALHVNGEALSDTSLFVHRGCEICSRGRRRKTLVVGLSRACVFDALSGLTGVGPQDVQVPTGHLKLPPVAVKRLRSRLLAFLRLPDSYPGRFLDADTQALLASQILNVMMDYLLCASQDGDVEDRVRRCPSHIVRAAEQHFEDAGGRPVSLADLCRAANVSASTLTSAFHSVVGETPARYFKLRRMSQARALLESGVFDRSPVKQAALSVGLTELGRFSVEYKKLFGCSPSDFQGQALPRPRSAAYAERPHA